MAYTRRQFFAGVAHAFADRVEKLAVRAVAQLAPDETDAPSFLRPPGALDEPQFLKACTRCTDCIEACPYDSIRRLGPEFGAAAGTPAIIPDESPCYLCEDMPCIAACNDDALFPTDRAKVRMGSARINMDVCYQANGQPCDYCVVRCPLKPDAIAFDGNDLPAVDLSKCAGCGVCAYLCPADAIEIREPFGQSGIS